MAGQGTHFLHLHWTLIGTQPPNEPSTVSRRIGIASSPFLCYKFSLTTPLAPGEVALFRGHLPRLFPYISPPLLVFRDKAHYRPVAALDSSSIQEHSAADPIAVAACQSAKVDDRSAAIERQWKQQNHIGCSGYGRGEVRWMRWRRTLASNAICYFEFSNFESQLFLCSKSNRKRGTKPWNARIQFSLLSVCSYLIKCSANFRDRAAEAGSRGNGRGSWFGSSIISHKQQGILVIIGSMEMQKSCISPNYF